MTAAASPAPSSPAPSPAKKWRKRLLWGVGAGVVVLGGLVALGPTIASTSPVRQFALGQINAKIPGKLAIKDWSFSWLGTNRFTAVAFTDDGGHTLTVADVHTERLTLLQGVLGGRVIGVKVSQVRGQLPTVLKPKASAQAKEKSASSAGPAKIPQAGLALDITDVDVTAEVAGQRPVRLTADTLLALDATDLNQVTAASDLKLAQDGGAQGKVAFKAQIGKLLTPGRALDLNGAQADVKLDVTDLPIAAIDAMAGNKGLVAALLDAKKLDAHVSAKGGMKDLQAQVTVDRDGKRMVALSLASDGAVVKANQSELLRLPVTQAFLDKVAPGQAAVSPDAILGVCLESFTVPVSPKLDLDAAHFSFRGGFESAASFRLTAAQIKTTDGQPVGLGAVGFFARTEKLGDGVSAGLDARLFAGQTADSFALEAQVAHPLADERAIAAKFTVPLAVADTFAAQNGKITAFAGKQLIIEALLQKLHDTTMVFQLSSGNPALKMEVIGAFDKTASLSLAHSTIHTQIANALIAAFVPEKSWEGKQKPDLAKSGEVTADVDISALAFKPGDASFNLAGVPGFKDLQLNATLAGFDTALVGALAGKEDMVHGALGSKLGIVANLSAKDGHLLAQIAPKGDTLGGALTADITSAKPNQREVALSGAITFKATQALVGQFLKPPVDADGKVLPGGLRPVGDFALSADLAGTRLVLGEKGPDFGASQLKLSAKGAGLSLLDVAKDQTYAVALPDCLVAGAQLKDKLNADLRLTLTPQGANPTVGKVDVKAVVLQPVGADGVFDPAHAARTATVVATDIPLALADAFINKDDAAQTVLGSQITRMEIEVRQAAVPASAVRAALAAKLPEPKPDTRLAVKELTTPQAKVQPFEAQLAADGQVTLERDVALELAATPALAAHYGSFINPVLGLAQSGTTPMKMSVKADSFRFNANDPAAPTNHLDAVFDAGTLQLAYGGLLKQVGDALGAAKMLKVDTGLTRAPKAVIPPVALTLDGTKLNYRDFKISSGNLALDFSGAVDWKTQGLNLSMDLPTDSLLKMAPSLKGYLQPGAQLTMPLTGSMTSPQLDTGKLQSQLLALAAKAGVEGKLGDVLKGRLGDKAGGEVKGLLGGLLGGETKEAPKEAPKDGAKPDQPAPKKMKAKDLLKGLFGN